MGGCLSQDSVALNPLDDDEVPFKENNEFGGPKFKRKPTDTFFIYFLGTFLFGLFAIVAYCYSNGDILRLINGYDNCGNICGVNNILKNSYDCFGQDMRDKKLLQLTDRSLDEHARRQCVAKCDVSFDQELNFCIPTNDSKQSGSSNVTEKDLEEFVTELLQDFQASRNVIIILTLIAFGISIVILVLFRYFAAVVVWFILGASFALPAVIAAFCWILYLDLGSSDPKTMNDNEVFIIPAIFFSVFASIILLVILVARKRIKLVIELFKEAGKAVGAVPSVLVTPVFTFISLVLVLFAAIMFSLWIESSGFIDEVPDIPKGSQGSTFLYYRKNAVMKSAHVINMFGMLWVNQFLVGCQQMVVAGAVASWFFTRDKSTLRSPLKTSFMNLISYHLGSVALGSLIITVVHFIRLMLKRLEQGLKRGGGRVFLVFLQCLMDYFERFLKFLTRNAYIEIAIYGRDFCQSGRKAFRVLSNNAFRVIAINSVGDFVLTFSKLFVAIGTAAISVTMLKEDLHQAWAIITFVLFLAFYIAHSIMSVFEMVIDTLFICFCEDCQINDGMSKPYFMSKSLMAFVENSRKVLGIGGGVDRTVDA